MRPAQSSRPVTCPYGRKGSAWATGEHGGIDYGTPVGDPAYAMWGGTVIGYRRGGSNYGQTWGGAYGDHVVIDHDKLPDGSPGLWAVYAHLSEVAVSLNQRVTAGQQLGRSGATGNVSGPHLHVEVQKAATWRQGNYTNPQKWIDAQGGPVSNNYDYNYSGKPSGTLTVGQDYKRLDTKVWDPPRAGLEHVLVYLNCSGFVFDGGRPGRIRIRLNRLDGDYTAYQDYTVVPGQTELLITHTYFEQGDGTTTAVDLKCLDGLRTMTVGTRYVKRAVVTD